MLNLSKNNIQGKREYVQVILELFDHVEFSGENLLDIDIVFEVTGAFPNYYRTSMPESDPSALLYILVPNKVIRNVWPGNSEIVDGVKFGTAKTKNGANVPALAISKGFVTLYFCLTEKGSLIDGMGSLGI